MLGLIIAIIIFNFIAFKTNKNLTKNQVVHIWTFTIALQELADLYIDQKYHGYWYFSKGIEWESLLTLTIIIPPVNMMFLNWYPFGATLFKKAKYYFYWVLFMVGYEMITLLPEPWGYFNYGWWKIWYSVLVNPFLLMLVLNFYKWVIKIEKLNKE
ncbi:hypothetical protein CHH83_14835 [Bacillus sp. 7586-K]|uniref:Uncharacterized protein n=1 Tax=Metabacillus niabensis TaxID=324854 RepID=A0ABT9Z6J2_9BACI|nr:hypothetical protein [Metabacillus niabensis]MDQ0227876.1 hypothetical protein [Metabacillus niabensis]PAD68197.1 hypothetical protein CHH83_14835 [Bacillus sp. 7586-K]